MYLNNAIFEGWKLYFIHWSFQDTNDIEAKTTQPFRTWATAVSGLDSTHMDMSGNVQKTSMMKEGIPRKLRHDRFENETKSNWLIFQGSDNSSRFPKELWSDRDNFCHAAIYGTIRPLWEDRFVYKIYVLNRRSWWNKYTGMHWYLNNI